MNKETIVTSAFCVQSSVVHSLRPCWTALLSSLRECSPVVPHLRLAGRARKARSEVRSSGFEIPGTSNFEPSPIPPVSRVSWVILLAVRPRNVSARPSTRQGPQFHARGIISSPADHFSSFRTGPNHHTDPFDSAAKRRMPWLRQILSLHKP